MLRTTSLALALAAAAAHAQPWTHFAGNQARTSHTLAAPTSVTAPLWTASQSAAGATITFVGPSSIVTDGLRAYALGRIGTQMACHAFNQATGAPAWSAPVPAIYLDSWSTPAIDLATGIILIASGRYLTALDLGTGSQRWQTELPRNIVNASPLIVHDLGRAFITDYDGFGSAGSLHCINLRPLSPANPNQPGNIIWSYPLGSTSGNSPAHANGRIFVAAAAAPGGGPGMIYAFPADTAAAPEPLWTFTNSAPAGFFGGVTIAGNVVYAASYALYGGQFAANLVKLDAATGQLAWATSCNRTDTTPVVLPDGRIIVSGGIHGFGSVPSIQFFRDDGSAATLLWDSALATWTDLNNNTQMDPGEYLLVGGWTNQPVFWNSPAGPRLFAGASQPGTPNFAAATDLYLLNLDAQPTDPHFIISHYQGAGSSSAAVDALLFTLGASGLHAFGSPSCYANCDASTTPPILNVADFACYLSRFAAADPRANCDHSTTAPVLNVADFACFLANFAAGCP